MSFNETGIHRRKLKAGLLTFCLLQVFQRPTHAADCAHYRVLIATGAFKQAEEQLNEDAANKACAVDLARAYLANGQLDSAADWSNFARVFANRERDGELFYDAIYLKLLLAPDSPLGFSGAASSIQYDPDSDYTRLEKESPDRLTTLREEVGKTYETVNPYLDDPWSHPCPLTSRFWDRKFGTNTGNVNKICQLVSTFMEYQVQSETQQAIAELARTLEQLDSLDVIISQYQDHYLEKAQYYKYARQAEDESLSTLEKLDILAKALGPLNASNLTAWDPENVRPRHEQLSLMADMDSTLSSSELPTSQAISSWRRNANALKSGFLLRSTYSSAIDLWELWANCQHSEGRCLNQLCHPNPCTRFINATRIDTAEYIGKDRLSALKQAAETATKSVADRVLADIDTFFSAETPSTGESVDLVRRNSEALLILDEDYHDYVEDKRIQRLKVKADADIVIAQAPPSFREGDPNWVKSLRDFTAKDDPGPSYMNAISILKSYDGCANSIGTPLDGDDHCLKLIERWRISSRIRRRTMLMRYLAGAERLLKEKTSRIINDLVNNLKTKKSRLGIINDQVDLLNSEYSRYVADEKRLQYENARKKHPESLSIHSLALSQPVAVTTPVSPEPKDEVEPTAPREENIAKPASGSQPPARDRSKKQAAPTSVQEKKTTPQKEANKTPPVYKMGSVFNETTDRIKQLISNLEKKDPLFKVALSAWLRKDIHESSSVEKTLLAAITNLRSANLEDLTQVQTTLKLLSEFQNEADKKYPSPDEMARTLFVRNVFYSLRYLEQGNSNKAIEVLSYNIDAAKLTPEAREMIKQIEAAAALLHALLGPR